MPDGKISGWLIPPELRSRHQLLLGSAQVLLPQVLAERGSVDAFLHDGDPCYAGMVFEMALVWLYLRPGDGGSATTWNRTPPLPTWRAA